MRALDLFCKAGGATAGLQAAGYRVTGVDIEPQPNYCGNDFIQADVLTAAIDFGAFDFIWASPPCQDYSALKGLSSSPRGKLIPAVRTMLRAAGKPYCIENVIGAELNASLMLCGTMFGLGVWRHRQFELSWTPFWAPQCNHALVPRPIDVTGTGGAPINPRKAATGGLSRKPRNLNHAREVMGIDWMNRRELSQAIPPAYAEFIGRAFMQTQRIAA